MNSNPDIFGKFNGIVVTFNEKNGKLESISAELALLKAELREIASHVRKLPGAELSIDEQVEILENKKKLLKDKQEQMQRHVNWMNEFVLTETE